MSNLVKVYSVYDSKVEAYFTPFYMRTKGEALRAWEVSVNDSSTNFCKFPADYTLFEIGEWDETKGHLIPYSAKISLGTALEFKRAPETQMSLISEISNSKE